MQIAWTKSIKWHRLGIGRLRELAKIIHSRRKRSMGNILLMKLQHEGGTHGQIMISDLSKQEEGHCKNVQEMI
jgi:hypothetical protein